MNEKVDLGIVVREAREGIEVLHDEKAYVNEKVMKALIKAGAQIIKNHKQYTGTYLIEVMFDGIHFTHTSRDPLIPTISSQVH